MQMKQNLFGQWEIAGSWSWRGMEAESSCTHCGERSGLFAQEEEERQRQDETQPRESVAEGEAAIPESIAQKHEQPADVADAVLARGDGLPWAWRTGPSDSSERQHLEEMLSELPENTLITGRCGARRLRFLVGRDHRRTQVRDPRGGERAAVEEAGICPRVRQHGLPLAGFGGEEGNAAAGLAGVWVHNGKHPMCLVTNVLSKERLSDRRLRKSTRRVGDRTFLQNLQADLPSSEAPQPTPEHAQLEADCLAGTVGGAVCWRNGRSASRVGTLAG